MHACEVAERAVGFEVPANRRTIVKISGFVMYFLFYFSQICHLNSLKLCRSPDHFSLSRVSNLTLLDFVKNKANVSVRDQMDLCATSGCSRIFLS